MPNEQVPITPLFVFCLSVFYWSRIVKWSVSESLWKELGEHMYTKLAGALVGHNDIIAVGFSGAQSVKNLPAMQETQVWSLGQKDPLEKEMATHSSILAWEIPWTEKPGRLQSMGLQESDVT